MYSFLKFSNCYSEYISSSFGQVRNGFLVFSALVVTYPALSPLPSRSIWVKSDVYAYASQTTFTYYAVCPDSACGSVKIPTRGVCSMGRCLCSLPWLGDDCEILGLAPKVTPISPQTINEGDSFRQVIATSEVSAMTAGYGGGGGGCGDQFVY